MKIRLWFLHMHRAEIKTTFNDATYATINAKFEPVPSPRGGFGGLNPPKQNSKSPKLKRETQYISGVLVNF